MSFPNGLTASRKDEWFLTAALPSVTSQIILLSGVYQVTYRLSMARRFAGMTNFATKNGTSVSVADVAGMNGATGIWTSKDGASAISPDWTANRPATGSPMVGGTVYIDRNGIQLDSPMSSKGEETLDLVWQGPATNFDPLAMQNPVDALPDWNTSGESQADIIEGASPYPYVIQSILPENNRWYSPYSGTSGAWSNQNIFTMTLSRKFARLTSFSSLADLNVKVTGMPPILSGPGVTTTFDYAQVGTGTDGFKRLYVQDERVTITNSITGEGEHVLTLQYGSPITLTT